MLDNCKLSKMGEFDILHNILNLYSDEIFSCLHASITRKHPIIDAFTLVQCPGIMDYYKIMVFNS